MTLYRYLTPEWYEAAAPIRERFVGSDSTVTPLIANVTVTNVPFGDGSLELHSLPGVPNVFDPGHVDHASVTVTLGYQLARLIVLDETSTVLEMGFSSGEITADGAIEDLTQYWRSHIGDPAYVAMLEELRAITK